MKKSFIAFIILFTSNITTFAQDWFPLEVGNRSHYAIKSSYQVQGGSWWHNYLFKTLVVIDTVFYNSKKYYSVNGFFEFPSGTKVRYDDDSMKIFIYKNNTEYTYMDFSLPDSSILLQIQPNNTFLPITIISSSIIIMEDTLSVKGFFREAEYPDRYKKGWYYFGSTLGPVYQYEDSHWWMVKLDSFKMIEYLFFDSLGNTYHKKHSYSANIQFNPITFLPFEQRRLIQNFKIQHPLSVFSVSSYDQSRTYIESAYLEGFYSNGTDTLSTIFTITPTTVIDFSLNYPIDTVKYNQGYYFYYRIVAKDKGIIPSYYYKPDSGYYKLYWRDSTTSSIEDEHLLPTEFNIEQNFPNPFNPTTTFLFSIPKESKVIIKVYDIIGKEIQTLVNEEKIAGTYELNWDASGLPSGVYFYRMQAGDFITSKKMILLK